MKTVILSMHDVSSCGTRRIRNAISNVDGVESVQVFADTDRVVVDGSADANTLAAILQSKFNRAVFIVSTGREPPLQVSSDEDDDDEDKDEEEDQPADPEDWWPRNASVEWRGTDLSARKIREPSSSDQPLQDPSSWFYNFTLANSSSPSSDEEDDNN